MIFLCLLFYLYILGTTTLLKPENLSNFQHSPNDYFEFIVSKMLKITQIVIFLQQINNPKLQKKSNCIVIKMSIYDTMLRLG